MEVGDLMFDAYCPTCAKRHLVFATQIRGISQAVDHVSVAYQCWCGAMSTWTTSRNVDRHNAAAHSGDLSLAG
jgi:hypothetical protein